MQVQQQLSLWLCYSSKTVEGIVQINMHTQIFVMREGVWQPLNCELKTCQVESDHSNDEHIPRKCKAVTVRDLLHAGDDLLSQV